MFLTMLRNIRIPENVTIIQKLSLKHVSCSYFRRLEFLNAFLKQLPPKIPTESGAVCQFWQLSGVRFDACHSSTSVMRNCLIIARFGSLCRKICYFWWIMMIFDVCWEFSAFIFVLTSVSVCIVNWFWPKNECLLLQ